LSLSPTQLRIGNYIARSPEGVEPTNPEVASVQEGHIVVEPWGLKTNYPMEGDRNYAS
jgi:hypothetical protein